MALLKNTPKTTFGSLSLLLVLIALYSCDMLESDVTPQTDEDDVEVTGKEIFMLQDGTGIIDLYSMVRTSGTVRLDITGQPRRGELTELSGGLLQYSPNSGFMKGRDSFEFSVYSQNNNLLKRDSVIIIVETDSTNLPCGIYPQHDYVYGISSSTLINVLWNDVLCGDSTDIAIEIYRPQSFFPPDFGTAVVEGNNIRYTPGSSFSGHDQIFYRAFSLTDSTKYGIGIVTISETPVCYFDVFDDDYVFDSDTLISYDTLHLPIFLNDSLCGNPANSYVFTLLSNAHNGTGVFQDEVDQADFIYIAPDTITHSFTDSLTYRLCRTTECRTAKIYVTIDH